MQRGLVSIITPTYNCAQFISDTIRSIQAQTYTNWELIISDDCSTDGTKNIILPLLETDCRIIYIRNEVNYGAAITRNNALKLSKGRWIAFLDSDDLWTPDKLEKQIKFMERNNYNFSYTNYCEIDSEGRERGVFITGPSIITKAGMIAYCWPGCLTVMYDRNIIGDIQISDIKKNNDYAMWLKVCREANCYLLDECLAKYRRGRSGSISNHGVYTMIKWHYLLFNEAEGMSTLSSMWHTFVNLACGFYKTLRYVKKYKV